MGRSRFLSVNEDPPPMHRGRPVESGSTVPRFHTELVPCVNKRYHRSLYRPQPPPTHQCPLYNDCKHSVPSAHPRNHPDGAVPWNRGTGTGTTVPVPNCAQARVSLGDPVPTTTPPHPTPLPPHPPTHQCPLCNDCKHSIPSAHPCGTTPAGAVPFHGTGTGTMVPVPICAQARGTLGGRSRPGVLGFFSGPGTVSRARLSDVGSLPPSTGVFAGGGTGTGATSSDCGAAGSSSGLPLSPPP